MDVSLHLDELIDRACRHGQTQFTPFLDPATARVFIGRASKASLEAGCFGGYPQAERIMCFCGWDPDPRYPITALEISWDARFGTVEHHDVLGAVMGLGLSRERFGDLLCYDDHAYLFAHETSARLIEAMLTSCGRVPVHVCVCEHPQIEPRQGLCVTATFASPRLDAILSAALRVSRTIAQKLVSQGLVSVNFVQALKPDVQLKPQDVISVRGKGRIIIRQSGGKSKKDRTYITLEVFLH